jgi:hypothetical protein
VVEVGASAAHAACPGPGKTQVLQVGNIDQLVKYQVAKMSIAMTTTITMIIVILLFFGVSWVPNKIPPLS